MSEIITVGMTEILSPSCFCVFFPSLYYNIVMNTFEHDVLLLLAVVTVQVHTFKIACFVLA